jgi:hypothetical protein
MRRLALLVAVAAALVVASFGAHLVWGDHAQASAADGDSIMWGT